MARYRESPLALSGWCIRAASDHPNAPTGERQGDDGLPRRLVMTVGRYMKGVRIRADLRNPVVYRLPQIFRAAPPAVGKYPQI
jgi:hypothetical protein